MMVMIVRKKSEGHELRELDEESLPKRSCPVLRG